MDPMASWVPSPHFYTGRAGRPVKYIILHGTFGRPVRDVINSFQNPRSRISAHYIVARDGAIFQCVNEDNTASANSRIEMGADPWWTENPDRLTISIELEKISEDNSDALTLVQKAATFKLIYQILQRHPQIRRQRATADGGITGHHSIAPISKANCPGTFPWDELLRQNGLNSGYHLPPPPPPPPSPNDLNGNMYGRFLVLPFRMSTACNIL